MNTQVTPVWLPTTLNLLAGFAVTQSAAINAIQKQVEGPVHNPIPQPHEDLRESLAALIPLINGLLNEIP